MTTAKSTTIDPEGLPEELDTDYPPPFDAKMKGRRKRVLGDAVGLTSYGVNLVVLPPGAWSSQRHWHSHEDEFVYVVSGQLVLVSDAGEETLTAGMAAGFPAGRADGHHLVNKSTAAATYLEIGDRSAEDVCSYPDIDLHLAPTPDGHVFTNKKGEPY